MNAVTEARLLFRGLFQVYSHIGLITVKMHYIGKGNHYGYALADMERGIGVDGLRPGEGNIAVH